MSLRFISNSTALIRKTSATKVGDRVAVEVRFDAAYRGGPMHSMPSWFRAALARTPRAKKAWDSLIPSRKKEILRYFSRLKSDEARDRNLQRTAHLVRRAGPIHGSRLERRTLAKR